MDSTLRVIGVTLIVCLVTATGCTTRSVVVDPGAYAEAARDGDSRYRIRTIGGKEYIATFFTVTDSTLTIRELKGTGDTSMHEPRYYPGVELPLELSLDQVASVERLGSPTKTERGISTAVLVIATVSAVALVALSAISLEGL